VATVRPARPPPTTMVCFESSAVRIGCAPFVGFRH
jgi:hypothetical protein